MNSKGRLPVLLIFLLTVAIIGVWVYYGLFYAPNARISATYMEVYQEIDPEEVDRIDLKSVNHKLIVKASEDEKIRINYFQQTDNVNTYNVSNGIVTLSMRERVTNMDNLFFQSSRKIDTITVYLPADYVLSLSYDTISGTADVSNISLNVLNFSSVSNGIKISTSSITNIFVNTNEGNLEVSNVEFERLNVTEISGTVNVNVDNSLKEYNTSIATTYGILNINGNRIKEVIDEKETVVNYYKNSPEEAEREIIIVAARSNININSVEPQEIPVEEAEEGAQQADEEQTEEKTEE